MSNSAYITLLTRSSYLAGVVILAQSLAQQQSKHPLIICYTPSLPAQCIEALELEIHRNNIILRAIEPLQPPSFSEKDLIAQRFADTWCKLRVFEPWNATETKPYTRLCFLDADMMLRQNLDFIFDICLPGSNWLAANHACVCNRDSDAWAPSTWTVENCAYTNLTHPANPTPVPKSTDEESSSLTLAQKETHTLLNSGLFLFEPSTSLWNELHHTFITTSPEKLKTYIFPDQDFLINFFRDRWRPIGWQVNALKTMRYWHPNIWRDEAAVNIHYIVDKPWAGPRPRKDENGEWSKAGYLGRDGETHSWWWDMYDAWAMQRVTEGDLRTVEIVKQCMYGSSGRHDSMDLRAIGSEVQNLATNATMAKKCQTH